MKICDRCGCKIGELDTFSYGWRELFHNRTVQCELCINCKQKLIELIDKFIENSS